METNQKKLEGDFTFISSAILDEALEYTGHSYCDISFEISTNMYVESGVDVVDKNNKSVGGVTDYWGSSEIYVIKTQIQKKDLQNLSKSGQKIKSLRSVISTK